MAGMATAPNKEVLCEKLDRDNGQYGGKLGQMLQFISPSLEGQQPVT